jgi:YVTN family beta-propeller protein
MNRQPTIIILGFFTACLMGILFFNFDATPSARAASCTQDANNLTTNGSMAGPGHSTGYGIVADAWTPFVLSADVPHFEWVDNENANGDVAGTGAQYIWADLDGFDAGIYQTVGGLTSGAWYQFSVGQALAAFDLNGGGNTRTTTIGRQVGVDPYGGTNPLSANVQWGVVYWDGIAALNIAELSKTFQAQANQATIFIRVVNQNINNGRSKVWFDVICMHSTTPPPPTPTPGPIYVPFISKMPPPPPSCLPLSTVATISVGTHPKGLAADASTNRIFTALYDDSSVAVIDASTNQKTATWGTGNLGRSNGIGATAGKIFVSMRDTSNLVILNATTGGVLATRTVGSLPYGVGAASGRAYIANFGSNSVSVVDAGTMNVIATTDVGDNPSQVAASSDRAFVSYYANGVAVVASDGTLLNDFNSLGASVFGVALDPVANRLYVSNRTTKQIYVLNASTGAQISSVTLAQTPYALAVNVSSGHLFVVLADSNQLDVRDTTTLNRVVLLNIGTQSADGGDGVVMLNNRVYVSNYSAGTVSVIQDVCP